MNSVITTRDIPTLSGVIRAGVLLSVVSWGEDGAANLAGLNGWPRVSLAAAESFELSVVSDQVDHQPSAISHQHSSTTETRRHGGESHDCEELRGVSVNAEPLVTDEGEPASGLSLDHVTATACEPDEFPTCDPVLSASEVNTPAVNTSFPSVPLCLRGSSDSGHQPSAVSHQPPPQQETSHDQSRSVRVTPTHDTAGDRGRDPQAVGSSGGDGLRDDSEACPFEAQRVSGLHPPVSRGSECLARSFVGDLNAELAASGGERFELTRELREQVRFARAVSGGRNGWPVMRAGNKTPEQLTITVDPEAVGMPSYPRSSWHPQRSHWPEPWRLAEYGITAMGRTFWNADHPDIRPDGHAWLVAIDLDKSEVCIRGHWQRMEFTTEARRHGDESHESEQTAGAVQVIHNVRISSSASTEDSYSIRTLTASGEDVEALGQPQVGSGTTPTTAYREVGEESKFHSPAIPSVSPCLRGSTWPEPHDGMTLDERRGWRPSGFGAAPGETLQEFVAWKKRLDEFFEQKTSKETKEGAAV